MPTKRRLLPALRVNASSRAMTLSNARCAMRAFVSSAPPLVGMRCSMLPDVSKMTAMAMASAAAAGGVEAAWTVAEKIAVTNTAARGRRECGGAPGGVDRGGKTRREQNRRGGEAGLRGNPRERWHQGGEGDAGRCNMNRS